MPMCRLRAGKTTENDSDFPPVLLVMGTVRIISSRAIVETSLREGTFSPTWHVDTFHDHLVSALRSYIVC